MRLRRIITAAVAAAFLLSGCSALSLSGPDILAPPKAAGHRAEIQSMIEKDAGGDYTLLYPASGEYKSGILLHDIDGDGTDEAAALYLSGDGTPRMLTAVMDGESYRFLSSTPLRSQNIGSLRFADVNADGRDELLVGSDIGTSLAALDAYVIDDTLNVMTVAEGFSDFITGDFDGNSTDDILLLSAYDGETPAQATLTVYTDEGFVEKSSCEIDGEVASYIRLGFDRVTEDISGAMLDGELNDGRYTTQLIYYDSAAHALLNPFYIGSDYLSNIRAEEISCEDIDDDGVIDIPLCSPMVYTKDEDAAAVCSIVHWCLYDADLMEAVPKRDAMLCGQMGFMLYLSPELLNAVTARQTADNAVTIYALSYRGEEPVLGAELLTVKRYEKNSYDSSLTAEANLYEDGRYVYTYILGEGSTYTHDDIENSFSLTETE